MFICRIQKLRKSLAKINNGQTFNCSHDSAAYAIQGMRVPKRREKRSAHAELQRRRSRLGWFITFNAETTAKKQREHKRKLLSITWREKSRLTASMWGVCRHCSASSGSSIRLEPIRKMTTSAG